MGVIKQGILGGVSGKVGSIVGTSWKGIAVLKSLPLSVTNPKTAAQVAQRSKMTNVVAFAGSILSDVIKPLWDRFAQQMSGFNDFVSTNISQFATAIPSSPATLVMSKGKMSSTAVLTASLDVSDAEITINWSDDSGQGLKLTSDEAYVVVVDSTTGGVVAVSAAEATRVTSVVTFSPLVALVALRPYWIYLAFRRADGTVVSDNSYKVQSAQA